MPFVLRKIRKSKWYKHKDVPWLEEGDLQADALGDLETTGNKLSVWCVDDDRSNLIRIITALAASCETTANFDYVLLDMGNVLEFGIQVIKDSEGAKTLDQEANISWHYHLIQLSLKKLLKLVAAIMDEERKRIYERDVLRYISQGISNGEIPLEGLESGVLEKLERRGLLNS